MPGLRSKLGTYAAALFLLKDTFKESVDDPDVFEKEFMKYLKEEGVEFVWLSSPKKFIGETKVKEVEVNKMKLGDPDSSGRKKPEIDQGSEFKISADIVIKSLGFDPENIPKLFNANELVISKWGTIKIDLNSMQTNLDGVFAAGDIVRGASLVVWAIRDGRDAAEQIEKYLQAKISQNKSHKAA